MAGMPSTPDDAARPIPVRDPAAPEEEPGDEAVYLVDTRGRRRGPRSGRGASPAGAAAGAAGAAAGSGGPGGPAARPAPDVLDATRTMPTVPPAPPAPPAGTTPTPPRSPRRRRRPRWGRVAAGALAAYLLFLVATPLLAWASVTRVDTDPGGDRPADSAGHTYVLVGSDSREGLTAQQRRELTTGGAAGRRTDSIMLVHVPSGGGKSVLVSVPRDSYVPIPGHGSNKVNAAFAIGGPKLLVQTLEQVTGLRVDGYVEIGFAGFADVVDSLGGVRICVPFDMDDPRAGIDLRKGCQVLDGPNALGYVRARYSDPRGDIGRAERQRQFLAAVMAKAASPSTVLVPWRWWGFTHAVADGVVIGEDTSMLDAGRVGLTLRGVSGGSTLSLVVPVASTDYATSAGSAVKWDTERARALFATLRDGEPLEAPPPGTDGKPAGG
jgi:LCP family protein required for cell wall assembly